MWKKKQTEEPKNKDITRESYLQTVFRRFRRHHLAAVSLVILVILGGAALLAPVIAPYDPDAIVGSFSGAPNLQFWLGTDQIGRDVFSRLLFAMRISLLVGVMATLISTVIGVVLGLIAGYFGGVADMIIMRFTDMVMSFPYILLVLVAASIFKPGLWNIILILGFVDWPGIARLVRGNVAQPSGNQFYQGKYCGGYAPQAYSFFGDPAEYGGTYPGIRHFCAGAFHAGRSGPELSGNGSAAPHGQPWKYAERRTVTHGAHQTALALDSPGTPYRGAGHRHQLYR